MQDEAGEYLILSIRESYSSEFREDSYIHKSANYSGGQEVECDVQRRPGPKPLHVQSNPEERFRKGQKGEQKDQVDERKVAVLPDVLCGRSQHILRDGKQ